MQKSLSCSRSFEVQEAGNGKGKLSGDYTGVVTDQKFTEKDRKLLNEMGAVIIEV